MATPTAKVNDIRAWQSSWNPVQTSCVTKVEHEGEWRARAWRRRVKQVEVEPRGTVHRRYYCFVYEVFAPCARVTTIRYQATRQFQPARWESASPLVRSLPRISASFPRYSLPCFCYFRVSRHILIKSTYFHGCAFFARFARSTAQRDFHSHRDAYSNSWYYAFREIYAEGMVYVSWAICDSRRAWYWGETGKGFWEIKCFFVDSVLNYRWGSLKNRELVEIFAFGSDKVLEFYRGWIFCKFEHCRICIGNYWLMYICRLFLKLCEFCQSLNAFEIVCIMRLSASFWTL